MTLTPEQMKEFSDANAIPVGKILCIIKAAYGAYECFIKAGDDKARCECGLRFFADVEKCLRS